MIRFNDIPIGKKIDLIVGLGMGFAIVVVLLAFLAFDRYLVKKSLMDELTGLARVTSLRSAVALIFDDRRNAEQNLKSLSVRESILSACIYKVQEDGTSKIFARFERRNKTFCQEQLGQQKFLKSVIVIVEPIEKIGKTIGYTQIISSTDPINERTLTWVWLSILMFVVAMTITLIITRRMKSAVEQPLKKLADTMNAVVADKDLTLRVEPTGRDEVGHLIQRFNTMLNIIHNGQLQLEYMYHELVSNSAEAEKNAAELEGKNQQIKDMLSGAAHDLRQPLQAMAFFIEAIVHQNQDHSLVPLMEKLEHAMQNLNELFSEILDVSRAENLGSHEMYKNIALDEMFESLKVEFSALANKKNIIFRLHTRGHRISTIPGLLQRVVRNLISNAINYTEVGFVLVAERIRGGELLIEVWDSGCGIAEDKKDSIFEKFEKANELNEKPGSYGLGLALVKQFIEMLGYSIEVSSIVGRGSRFRLIIPIENIVGREGSDMIAHEIASAPKQNLSIDDLDKTHVLLIDDDDKIRTGLEQLLDIWGMAYASFASIEQMSDYLESEDYIDPDIIISDYQLGDGQTGDMAIEKARVVLGVNVPAFIITGNREDEVHEEIMEKGFEFLLKPVNTKALKKKIDSYVND